MEPGGAIVKKFALSCEAKRRDAGSKSGRWEDPWEKRGATPVIAPGESDRAGEPADP